MGFSAICRRDSKSLPATSVGQDSTVCPSLMKTTSEFSVTAPVAPSMLLITFCVTIGVAHRNSPVSRSRV